MAWRRGSLKKNQSEEKGDLPAAAQELAAAEKAMTEAPVTGPAMLRDVRLARPANAGPRAALLRIVQQALGNATVRRMTQTEPVPAHTCPLFSQHCPFGGVCHTCPVQAKLVVNPPGDIYEQEADRVAEAVLRMPAVPLQGEETPEEEEIQAQRLPAPVMLRLQRQEEEEEEEAVQAMPVGGSVQAAGGVPQVTPDLEERIARLRGGGQPLAQAERAFFEPRFGLDFGGVRLHTGSEAGGVAASLQARAFTVGQDIVFGPGQYAPETMAGRRLLAHELAHVVQQMELPGLVQRVPASNTGGVTVTGPSTSYYNVAGNTLAEVAERLGTDEWGRCTWDFRYTYRSTNGVATRVDVTLRLRIRLPRWSGRGWNRASAAAKAEWNRMLAALRAHEDGHASRARTWATTLRSRLLNRPEGDLADLWQTGMDEHEAAQAAYDTETNHGQTQGVSLDTSIT